MDFVNVRLGFKLNDGTTAHLSIIGILRRAAVERKPRRCVLRDVLDRSNRSRLPNVGNRNGMFTIAPSHVTVSGSYDTPHNLQRRGFPRYTGAVESSASYVGRELRTFIPDLCSSRRHSGQGSRIGLG